MSIPTYKRVLQDMKFIPQKAIGRSDNPEVMKPKVLQHSFIWTTFSILFLFHCSFQEKINI